MDDEAFGALVARIEEAQPDLEVDPHRGEQPLYPVTLRNRVGHGVAPRTDRSPQHRGCREPAPSLTLCRACATSAARAGEALDRLGIERVRDLLLHVPHRYLDFTHVTKVAFADAGEDATIVATVDKVNLKRPRPRMQIVELYVMDDTGVLVATFFRQPWIAEQVKPGDMVALSGKVTFAYGFRQMKAPFYEVLGSPGEASSYARVLPVHPVGEGVTAPWMRLDRLGRPC